MDGVSAHAGLYPSRACYGRGEVAMAGAPVSSLQFREKASPSVNGRAIGSNSLTEEPNQSVSNLQQL
jgi:hypothetical protein